MNALLKKKLKKSLGILIDIVIMLALITSMVVAIVITVQRSQRGFAGYGTVQSESMKASGLNVGDVVKVRLQKEYSIGDIIVFYRATDKYDDPLDEDSVKNCEIWIHEVVDVRDDSLGRKTYLTKGSSNATDDGAYVPQDFVLGKATKLKGSTISFLNFVCSVKGIIFLVEIPCGLVLIYLVWDLIMFLTADKNKSSDEKDSTANKK